MHRLHSNREFPQFLEFFSVLSKLSGEKHRLYRNRDCFGSIIGLAMTWDLSCVLRSIFLRVPASPCLRVKRFEFPFPDTPIHRYQGYYVSRGCFINASAPSPSTNATAWAHQAATRGGMIPA